MTWEEYVENAKHPMVEEATFNGKEAVKVFVKSIKERMAGRKDGLNDEIAKRFEADINFRYIQTAFMFFKYLHQTPEFRNICKEDSVIPIAVIWEDQLGQPGWMTNLIGNDLNQHFLKLWGIITNLYANMTWGMMDLSSREKIKLEKTFHNWVDNNPKFKRVDTKTDE